MGGTITDVYAWGMGADKAVPEFKKTVEELHPIIVAEMERPEKEKKKREADEGLERADAALKANDRRQKFQSSAGYKKRDNTLLAPALGAAQPQKKTLLGM